MISNIPLKRFAKISIQLVLVPTILLLAQCTNKKVNGKQVFYYNESSGIATLDPAFAKNQSIMWAVHQIYNTLVEIDTGLHIVPSIAKKWEVSDNRLVYTFHLRTGIKFHDNEAFSKGEGRFLVAGDVVFSFNRILDKNTASSGTWIFNNRFIYCFFIYYRF